MKKLLVTMPSGSKVIVNLTCPSQLEEAADGYPAYPGAELDALDSHEEKLPRYYLNTQHGRDRFTIAVLREALDQLTT